ncbi:MAG: hypothetical protein WKF82_07385 [Nocardioidaceae bacterium]
MGRSGVTNPTHSRLLAGFDLADSGDWPGSVDSGHSGDSLHSVGSGQSESTGWTALQALPGLVAIRVGLELEHVFELA